MQEVLTHSNQWNEATEVKDTEEKWKVFLGKLMYTQKAVSYPAINMFGGGRKRMDDLCSEKSNQMRRKGTCKE